MTCVLLNSCSLSRVLQSDCFLKRFDGSTLFERHFSTALHPFANRDRLREANLEKARFSMLFSETSSGCGLLAEYNHRRGYSAYRRGLRILSEASSLHSSDVALCAGSRRSLYLAFQLARVSRRFEGPANPEALSRITPSTVALVILPSMLSMQPRGAVAKMDSLKCGQWRATALLPQADRKCFDVSTSNYGVQTFRCGVVLVAFSRQVCLG